MVGLQVKVRLFFLLFVLGAVAIAQMPPRVLQDGFFVAQSQGITTVTTPLSISTTNLVMWYEFNEGTGTTASNSVSSSYTAYLTNTTWGTRKTGSGYTEYDGLNKVTVVPNPGNLFDGTNITICVWLYYSDTSGTGKKYFLTRGKEYQFQYFVDMGSQNNLPGFKFWTSNGSAEYETEQESITRTNWVNLSYIFDKSTHIVTIYKDAVYLASFQDDTIYNAALQSCTGDMAIGSYIDNYQAVTVSWIGRVSDLAIYNRALTTNEITQYYNATK